MGFKGSREFPLLCIAASQLQRNRVVTITKATMTAAYATYGAEGDGITHEIGEPDGSYQVNVMPVEHATSTLLVQLAGTVAKGDALVVASAVGTLKTSGFTAVNDTEYDNPGAPANPSTYLIPADGWATASTKAGYKAIYTGSWAYTAPTTGDVCFVTDRGYYLVYNGSAWVKAPVIGYAEEAGVSGDQISVYTIQNRSELSRLQMPSSLIDAMRVIAGGVTACSGTTSHVIYHPDIASGDTALVNIASSTNAVTLQKATVTDNTITVLTSGDVGATSFFNWVVLRAI